MYSGSSSRDIFTGIDCQVFPQSYPHLVEKVKSDALSLMLALIRPQSDLALDWRLDNQICFTTVDNGLPADVPLDKVPIIRAPVLEDFE